ncbi:MAG: SRPBCC family protein [Lentisphaeria bacterium]|nr:SRPBCC family protein [Lentisphaeria bacterium]
MSVYSLKQEQVLHTTLDRVWDYISTPINLNDLTPEFLQFEILSDVRGQKMFQGQFLEYKVKIFPAVWTTWVTEIKHVVDYHSFVDEQRVGPFKIWYHRHVITEVPEGVHMLDEVHWVNPLGPIGDVANSLYVGPRVRKIFDHRYNRLEEIFNGGNAVNQNAQMSTNLTHHAH